MGFSYLSAAEFIRWPSTLGTPEGQLEQPQATGTEPQALLGTVFPLQGELEGSSSFAESESAAADSWDFFSEPKRAARA